MLIGFIQWSYIKLILELVSSILILSGGIKLVRYTSFCWRMPLECKYIAPFCVCYDCRNVKGLTQVAGVCIRSDISAGSAAAGVTNLNRTGIWHSALADFCKPLHHFCDRMAVSLTFAFLSCLFLAISTILDVLWLSILLNFFSLWISSACVFIMTIVGHVAWLCPSDVM